MRKYVLHYVLHHEPRCNDQILTHIHLLFDWHDKAAQARSRINDMDKVINIVKTSARSLEPASYDGAWHVK